MIDELIKANCIKIGNFKLKNGEVSKYYYDMKNLIAHPQLLLKRTLFVIKHFLVIGLLTCNGVYQAQMQKAH